MRVLYFGTYERGYPRNAQVISCLRRAGVDGYGTVRDEPLPSGPMTGGASCNVYVADELAWAPRWSVTVTVNV